MLAAAAPSTVYAPEANDVVQAELAAEAAAAVHKAQRNAARADEFQALRELGTLGQTEPRDGDEAVRDELTRRAGGYIQADVDAWLARALAAHLGHYRDPAARAEATAAPGRTAPAEPPVANLPPAPGRFGMPNCPVLSKRWRADRSRA